MQYALLTGMQKLKTHDKCVVTETCFLKVLGSIHNVNLFERAKLCRLPSLKIKLKY